ncbi:hypothetical protein [Streptomyces sp. MZ04]|uniref:hypothetical protein n=1 Tax=Streptomyces sp. MZ04 TaxID=2559236 RepID=UPI00107ED373|nr:hypothetical protein [Streptomyces sp. MZ04]TGB14207.1 hypothetical protein E2651_06655 [Streptomyces sp. MZ04]
MVVVATGCLPKDSADAAKDSPDAPKSEDSAPASVSPSPSSSPSRPLTAGKLKSLLLREGEVPQVDSAPVQGPVPKYDPRVLVPGPGCQEVFDALVSHHASTSVIQDFWWKNNQWGGRTWLASYAAKGAEEEFQGLKKGLKTCKKLVGVTPDQKLNSRITVAKSPALGDEAVAFDLSMDGPGDTVVTDRQIFVRVGGLTVNMSDRGAQRNPGFPLDVVVDKQVARLTQGPRG